MAQGTDVRSLFAVMQSTQQDSIYFSKDQVQDNSMVSPRSYQSTLLSKESPRYQQVSSQKLQTIREKVQSDIIPLLDSVVESVPEKD